MANIFSTKLERIIHLNSLAQASNQVLVDHAGSMLDMWRQIDLHKISDRAGWIAGDKNGVIGEQCNKSCIYIHCNIYIHISFANLSKSIFMYIYS